MLSLNNMKSSIEDFKLLNHDVVIDNHGRYYLCKKCGIKINLVFVYNLDINDFEEQYFTYKNDKFNLINPSCEEVFMANALE